MQKTPAGSGLELPRCGLMHGIRGDEKESVCGSLVVTFAAAKCQGPRFYLGQGKNLNRDFYSMRTPVPPLGPQHRVAEPVPKPGNSHKK